MKINAIQANVSYQNKTTGKRLNKPRNVQPTFNGRNGETVGAAAGLFAGVVASFFCVTPLAPLAISAVGLIAGGLGGGAIEDAIDDTKDKKKK